MSRRRRKPLGAVDLDLNLLPGISAADRRRVAQGLLRRGQKPIAIKKVGSKYQISALGAVLGTTTTKAEACSTAHLIGRYKLDLGDFAYTYVDGWKGCDR